MSAPAMTMPTSDFQELILTMDIVDNVRRQEDQLEKALLTDEDLEALKGRLQAAYRAQGIEVSTATIEHGIRARQESLFTYFPPTNSLPVMLAKMYVARDILAKRIAKWLTIGVTIAILIYAAISGVRWFQEYSSLDPVRDDLASLRQSHVRATSVHQRITDDIRSLSNPPVLIEVPVQLAVSNASEVVSDLARLLENTYPLTQLNGKEIVASARTTELQQSLLWLDDPAWSQSRVSELQDAKQLVTILANFETTESVFSSVDAPKRLAALWARDASVLETSLARGDVETAADYLTKLIALNDEAVLLRRANDEYLPLLERIESVAVSAQALQKVELERNALLSAMERGDAETLEDVGSRLPQLLTTLNASYTLHIVSRPGASTGVSRHPNSDRKARNYYLIVEAISASGQPLTLPIRNEENGRVESVRQWGIRVDEEVYAGVKADKTDNGIVDNAVLGRKEKGFLRPTYLFATSGGAITQW